MKNKVLIIVAILLLLPNAMAWAHQPADGNLKHFTKIGEILEKGG